MAEFQTCMHECTVIHKSRMNAVQILQSRSYEVYFTTSATFFRISIIYSGFGTQPLYTNSLLLCNEDI